MPSEAADEMVPYQVELAALQEIVDNLDPFDDATRARMLRWVNARFMPSPTEVAPR